MVQSADRLCEETDGWERTPQLHRYLWELRRSRVTRARVAYSGTRKRAYSSTCVNWMHSILRKWKNSKKLVKKQLTFSYSVAGNRTRRILNPVASANQCTLETDFSLFFLNKFGLQLNAGFETQRAAFNEIPLFQSFHERRSEERV